jgi:hypothetical protein
MTGLIPMAQLPVHAAAPGEEISVGCNSCRMVRPTSHLNNNLTAQRLSDAGDIFPAIVPMAQTAVISAPPGVYLAIGGEDNRVARTASNLRNTDTSKSINEGGLILVAVSKAIVYNWVETRMFVRERIFNRGSWVVGRCDCDLSR